MPPGSARRTMIARALCVALFVGSGVLHFLHPEPYRRIVPDVLPSPEALVAISGVAEVLGGLGLLMPRTRRLAGLGLIALLVAVFPANVNMAINHEDVAPGTNAALLWARLPLQLVLGWLVWTASRERGPA